MMQEGQDLSMWQNMWKKVQKMTKSNPNAAKKDQILHYFKTQWPVLLAVTISGLIYNLGLLGRTVVRGADDGMPGGHSGWESRIPGYLGAW